MINPKQAQKVKRLADEYANAAYNEGSAILEALASFATNKAHKALMAAIDALTTEENNEESADDSKPL